MALAQAAAPPVAPAAGDSEPRRQRRLLLVEDEVLVGLFMREMLDDLDFDATDPCRTLADGLAAAKAETFDGAVLDIILNGELVYPLADSVRPECAFHLRHRLFRRRGGERFAKIPIIQKPVAADTLATILQRHLGRRDGPQAPGAQGSPDNLVAFARAR